MPARRIKRKGVYKMIIDLILDRKDDDALLAQGYTHKRYGDGTVIALEFSPEKFYRDVMRYGDIGHAITSAMDYGTGDDVKKALCDYIDDNGYNPEIKGYVSSVNWI